MNQALFVGTPVSAWELLDSRESRAALQRTLLASHRVPLVCVTLNIPGAVKCFPLADRLFHWGMAQAEAIFLAMHWRVTERQDRTLPTGYEGFFAVDAPPELLKIRLTELEEGAPQARLLDLDVLAADGGKADRASVGLPPRRCFLCGEQAAACARSRAHSSEALSTYAKTVLWDWYAEDSAAFVGEMAERALLYEVAVTPKPGLVDRLNRGAHKDMDFFTFLRSGAALRPYFSECARMGLRFSAEQPDALLDRLRPLGLRAESRMCTVTNGVNTHKGAIFSLGLLSAAAGRLIDAGRRTDAKSVCREAALLARQTLPDFVRLRSNPPATAGERAYARHGLCGARGEAAEGFPLVRECALPALQAHLCAHPDDWDGAGCAALLALLSRVADTNIIKRAGRDALDAVQRQASALLQAGLPDSAALAAFDDDLIRRNISPGGCADLLSVAFFLYFLAHESMRLEFS